MKRILIFDVDGVLLDTMSIWSNSANAYLKEKHGIVAYEGLDKECATMSLLESGEHIRKQYPQVQLSARQLADGVAEFIRERYWNAPEMPGMTKTVRWLKEQGFTLYLATASERINVQGALTRLGVWDCFTDMFTCTEVGYSKNYVAYYEEVARCIGVPNTALTMVEDSLHSMKTAKEAGLFVVGVYEENSADRQEEIRQVCDAYLSEISELQLLVKKQGLW